MRNSSRSGKPAFTLVELMAVITITVILAGLVVGGMGFVKERQAKETARVQIALLSKAIEDYKLDMGAYPGISSAYGGAAATAANNSAASEVLYNALFKEGYDWTTATTPGDPGTLATKIYLSELDPRSSKQRWVTKTSNPDPTANLDILDPWGNPYRYRVGTLLNGTTNTAAINPDFDLWSTGKDGMTNTGGTDEDIKDNANKDDIKN